MKIKKLNLTSYGKFENKEINFTDGLNIICGKNEAGKSTVMAFIRAMLYGFSGRGNVLANDRKHFLPWGKTTLSGSADILLDNGKTVKISRTSGKSQGFDKLECFDISNSESYPFSPEKEMLCGEETFLKTLCIKQLQTPISGEEDEISQKLINLTQTASEDISTGKSEGIITDYLKKFKALRGEKGLIFELKNKIADINTRISDANQRRIDAFGQIKRKNELSEEINGLREKLAELKENSEGIKNRELFEKLHETSQKLLTLKEKLSLSNKELEGLTSKHSSLSAFENEAPEEMFCPLTETDSIKEEIENKENSVYTSKTLGIIFIALSVLSIPLFLLSAYLLLVPIAFIGFGIVQIIKAGNLKKQNLKLFEELDAIVSGNNKISDMLSKFGVCDIREYTEKKALFTSYSEKIFSLKNQIEELNQNIVLLEKEESELKAKTSSLSPTQSNYTLKELREEEEALSLILQEAIMESSRIDGSLEAALSEETPDILIAKRAELIAKLENAETEYEAATLALETLSEVFAEMRSDFTPLINQKSSEYLKELTGGSLDKIYVDKKFSVNAEKDSMKELSYFSLGTVDQTYLAIRLAIIDLIFQNDKPIIIDDAFLQYDEEREKAAFSLLCHRAAEGGQIIFFTCRPIPQIQGDINVIDLDNI